MVPRTDVLDTLAEALWQAQQPGYPFTPIPPFRETVAALDGDAAAHAYAIQERNTRRQVAAGHRLVGRKNRPDLQGRAGATGRRAARLRHPGRTGRRMVGDQTDVIIDVALNLLKDTTEVAQ